MEAYRKKLKTRFVVYVILSVIMGVMTAFVLTDVNGNSLICGYRFGFCFSVTIICIVNSVNIKQALSLEEQLKKKYIFETDERTIMIKQKASSFLSSFSYMFIAFAAIISSFFSETVFYTLVGVVLFLAITQIAIVVYCKIKY
jgi:hypothetical protein